MRLGRGRAPLLSIAAVGAWLGSTLAASQVLMPPMLRSYALALAIRALLAALLAHTCMFALRYAAGRRAKVVLVTLVLLTGTLGFATEAVPAARDTILRVGNFLISNPGPFGVVFGRWTLIDV